MLLFLVKIHELLISNQILAPLITYTKVHSPTNTLTQANNISQTQVSKHPSSVAVDHVGKTTVTWSEEEEGGTCRTLAPTLFLKAYDLGVRAKAVPRRAVVDGLEVSWDDVAHGQRGDHSFFCGDRFHCVAAGCPRLQHGFLPWPSLREDRRNGVYRVM